MACSRLCYKQDITMATCRRPGCIYMLLLRYTYIYIVIIYMCNKGNFYIYIYIDIYIYTWEEVTGSKTNCRAYLRGWFSEQGGLTLILDPFCSRWFEKIQFLFDAGAFLFIVIGVWIGISETLKFRNCLIFKPLNLRSLKICNCDTPKLRF